MECGAPGPFLSDIEILFLYIAQNYFHQVKKYVIFRKRRSGPVRSGSVRRSGLFWVDRIGPVFGKIDRTEPDRHVSEKYDFFNYFLDIFRVKSRFYFLKLSPIAHSEIFHHAGILYMNLTFNLTIDLTQSPRNPSSALHLYISLTITVFGNILSSLALPLSNEVLKKKNSPAFRSGGRSKPTRLKQKPLKKMKLAPIAFSLSSVTGIVYWVIDCESEIR